MNKLRALPEMYEARIGLNDSRLLIALLHDYIDLLRVWRTYEALFEQDAKSVAALNFWAPNSFGTLQIELLQSITVRVSNFFDRRRDTLSLPKLLKKLSQKEDLRELMRQAEVAAEKLIKWRNEHVAHKNLKVALRTKNLSVNKISGDEFRAAVLKIGQVLAAIHELCSDTELMWPQNASDAPVLLRVLTESMKQETKN